MSEFPDTAPVADGNSANELEGFPQAWQVEIQPPTSGLDQSGPAVLSVVDTEDLARTLADLDYKITSIAVNLEKLHAKFDHEVANIHAKMDDQRQGIVAVYNGVDGLVKMLSVVQQVASTMPFGKKMSKAIDAQMNGGNTP